MSYYSSYSRRYGTSMTKDDLREIVKEGWTRPRNSYDEVYPGILLGDGTTALSVRTLKGEGVTHVLNAAAACSECEARSPCGTCVLTKPSYYSHSEIAFKGVQAHDERRFPLYRHFEESTAFIDSAMRTGGKVYVHCQQGISRSATFIIAYLMMKRGMSAKEAVSAVRRKRSIFPNDGFFEQLCDLELRLKGQGSRVYA